MIHYCDQDLLVGIIVGFILGAMACAIAVNIRDWWDNL